MNIQNIDEFISEYDEIYVKKGFEEADKFLTCNVESIKIIDNSELAQLYLDIYSENAGHGDSYLRLCGLLKHFKNKGLIDEGDAKFYIESSPSNRWL